MEFNLADLFEAMVDAVADRTALVVGDRSLTYAELDERANRLAHHLSNAGLGPGDHLGLYLYNGTEYAEAMIACFKIRAVPININFRYVEEELRYLLDDSDVVGLLHHRELAPRVAAVAPSAGKIRFYLSVEDGSGQDLSGLGAGDYEQALAASSPLREFAPRSGSDHYIIYTGGTTGMPKGVVWRHEDLFFSGLMGANPMGPPPERAEEVAERASANTPIGMMSTAPFIHGAAQLGTWIAFLQGFKAVLLTRFDSRRAWEVISEEKVVSLSLVGDAMARPLAEALPDARGSCDVSSLLIVSSAGAIFSQAVKDQLKAELPNLVLLDNFGSSETGSHAGDAGGVSAEGGIRFKMNEHTVILDEKFRVIEPGSGGTGRVAVRGRVPLGYYKDPKKTAETFSEVDGVRYVLAGDMARPEADGTMTLFGRGSQCINSGGEKIFPEEVEGALKSHPDVFDAVVVGLPDARWGERVAAVVQAREGRQPTLEDLADHCRKHIASYKVPRVLHLTEHIVRSPSGKADYPWAKALVRRYL
ncbi:MAG: acyl-CoA synthetase [Myxococcota bacterium]